MSNKKKNSKYKDKTRARYNKKIDNINKTDLQESTKVGRKNDKIYTIINRINICLCVFMVALSVLYLLKLVEVDAVINFLLVAIVLQQGLTGVSAFREKNYFKLLFSIAMIIGFIVVFKIYL